MSRQYLEIRMTPFWFGGREVVVGGRRYYVKSNGPEEVVQQRVRNFHDNLSGLFGILGEKGGRYKLTWRKNSR